MENISDVESETFDYFMKNIGSPWSAERIKLKKFFLVFIDTVSFELKRIGTIHFVIWSEWHLFNFVLVLQSALHKFLIHPFTQTLYFLSCICSLHTVYITFSVQSRTKEHIEATWGSVSCPRMLRPVHTLGIERFYQLSLMRNIVFLGRSFLFQQGNPKPPSLYLTTVWLCRKSPGAIWKSFIKSFIWQSRPRLLSTWNAASSG